MAPDAIERIATEVSVYDYETYLGVAASDALGLGYNDKVGVVFPNAGASNSDVRVKGYLNSANTITVPKEITDMVREEQETEHKDAIVERLEGTWEAEHDLTSERWEGFGALKAKSI